MDGYGLFSELKKLNPKLPIIVSSGYGDTEVSARIGSDNIAGLISKPYNPSQLRDVLKSVLEVKERGEYANFFNPDHKTTHARIEVVTQMEKVDAIVVAVTDIPELNPKII